jgi:CSLREA domain-containing protein
MTFSMTRMFLAFSLSSAGCALANVITVNSTSDTIANDGVCTLREAIDAANNNIASGAMPGECAAGQALPVVDTIAFNVPGSGVHTFNPSAILEIKEAVKIDGYTQPGSSVNTLDIGDNAVLPIEIVGGTLSPTILIDGSFFGSGGNGSTIRGLVIDQNTVGNEINVGSGFGNGANDVTIVGNFLGIDPSGTTVSGANIGISAVTSSHLTIGGPAPADRNIVTTINQDAILLNQSSFAVIKGNYIGLNAAGTVALGNDGGIVAAQQANDDQIGGPAQEDRNVIFGRFHAIEIGSSERATIQNNYLGTDATGTVGMYGSYGIGLEGVSAVTIGGVDAGNVISGNNVGIQIGDAPGTIVKGNKIGVGPDGKTPVPNTAYGIQITASAPTVGSAIGGTLAGEGNIIANSCAQGVNFNQPGSHWPIRGNSMYANKAYGIALQFISEPTVNDAGDADTGANNLQNYPVLSSASVNAGGVASIAGSLSSEANKTYRVEFFSDVDCHPSGHGEGRTFVGFANLTTDASGNVSFGPMTFGGAPIGQTAFSATATDPDGNTSEFSMCVGGIGRIFQNGFEPSC